MKKILFFCLLFIAPVFALAQSDYDRYIPIKETPMVYEPLSTGEPLHILPYEEIQVLPTVAQLKTMVEHYNEYPELRQGLLGNWEEYNKLLTKYESKGKLEENIGRKKPMKHFQEDWTTIDRFLYERDCKAKIEAKEKSIRDSLLFREKFVSDSLAKRKGFIKDSLEARTIFVNDSLYRANFRKKGNYDLVEFDSPHGEPVRCYRRGKLIDGKTYNNYGLLEKEYKNGVLIHDYTYNKEYLFVSGKIPEFNDRGFPMMYDSAERVNYRYTLTGKALLDKEFLDEDGVILSEINYKGGEPTYKVTYTYYPDRKTVKLRDTVPLQGGDSWTTEYYSDGKVKEMRYYWANPSGARVVKERVIIKDGYDLIEHYDFDGKFERSETSMRNYYIY